jgi:hypothetical protein
VRVQYALAGPEVEVNGESRLDVCICVCANARVKRECGSPLIMIRDSLCKR